MAHAEYAPTAQLDLRPPGDSAPAIIHGDAGALASASFPSATHPFDPGKTDLSPADRIEPPTLGSGDLDFRVKSQAEILTTRIHREGLPVVRLWETKSALLHVGLNSRGKPGLWLIQKTH
ncbi:MAG: hypothetical protein ACLPV8_03495 [Steroidobacteraceae bacterium]